MTAIRTVVAGLLSLVVVVCAAGCTLPHDGSTQAVSTNDVPYGLLTPPMAPATSSTRPADLRATIFLTAADRVAPAEIRVQPGTTGSIVSQVLTRLAAGPDISQRQRALSTAIPSGTRFTVTRVAGGTAVVDVQFPDSRPATDLPRAIGQVVLSLTTIQGVTGVIFTQKGVPMQVPLADSEVSSDVVRAPDYSALIAPGFAVPPVVVPLADPATGTATTTTTG